LEGETVPSLSEGPQRLPVHQNGTPPANLLAALDELKAKVGIPLSIKDSGLEEKQWLDQIDQLAARDAEGRNSMHAWNGTRAELKYAH
jgi:alcohol dehydrogenase class IV